MGFSFEDLTYRLKTLSGKSTVMNVHRAQTDNIMFEFQETGPDYRNVTRRQDMITLLVREREPEMVGRGYKAMSEESFEECINKRLGHHKLNVVVWYKARKTTYKGLYLSNAHNTAGEKRKIDLLCKGQTLQVV